MSDSRDFLEALDALLRQHSADDHGSGIAFASWQGGANGSSGATSGSAPLHEEDEQEHDEHPGAADDDAGGASAGATAGTANAAVKHASAGVTAGGTATLTGGTTGTANDASATGTVLSPDGPGTRASNPPSSTDAAGASGTDGARHHDAHLEADLGDHGTDSKDGVDDDASGAAGGSGAVAAAADTGPAGTAVTGAPDHRNEHGQEHSISAQLQQLLGQSVQDGDKGLLGALLHLVEVVQNGSGEGHGHNAPIELGTSHDLAQLLQTIEAGGAVPGGQSHEISAAAVEHLLAVIGVIPEPISL